MADQERPGIWRSAPAGLIGAIALVLCALGASSTSSPDNVHAAIYQWADEHPGDSIPVLIRTNGDNASAAEQVTNAGGVVGRDFAVVSSIEARLPLAGVADVADSVTYLSLDAAITSADHGTAGNQVTTYPQSVGADVAWAQGFRGENVAVAVVDTGISPSGHEDFKGTNGNSRVIATVETNGMHSNVTDPLGHGTHVAGSIGGDGDKSDGKYLGVAPNVNLISVRVSNDQGGATLSDLVAGLEWVYNNSSRYNIKVVNLSLHSSVSESYLTSPLSGAVEALWLRGVMVVVAAGNQGAGNVDFPPANNPFVLTVGAINDEGTTTFGDDRLATFTSRGTTQDGFAKPEVYAPGVGIVAVAETNGLLYKDLEDTSNIIEADDKYLRLSGTSMAAGVMSGAAALAFQAHPTWTPGQVKCTVMSLKRVTIDGLAVPQIGKVTSAATPTCDSTASAAHSQGYGEMLKAGVVAWIAAQPDPTQAAASIGFSPVSAITSTGTLSIDSVKWDAIKWSAIKWDAIKWDAIKWDAIKWDAIKWSAIKWSEFDHSGVNFLAIKWSAIKWSAIKWDAIKWSAIKWSTLEFDAIKWSAVKWSFIDPRQEASP